MSDVAERRQRLRRDALQIYHAAIAAVDGRRTVVDALHRLPVREPFHLVAMGKAAGAMTEGARDAAGEHLVAGLVITKHGHSGEALRSDTRLRVLESDHPVTGQASLDAGEALLRFIDGAPSSARFLFLLSGGASSLVEVLPAGLTLADYRRANEWLLGSGLDIHRINAVRKRLSAIKGGKLARFLGDRSARCLLISDVPGDRPASIGSGVLTPDTDTPTHDALDRLPGWLQRRLSGMGRGADATATAGSIPHEIIASNHHARAAACACARRLGYDAVEHPELLVGDALGTGRECARKIVRGGAGVSVWGGETTITLPADPGRGGRNQSVALAGALELAGDANCVMLAAGSDGTDGPTEDAGAVVDGGTVERGEVEGLHARECLARADAGTFLAASGDLIQTGPTGTNVMDLVIGIKGVRTI